MDAATAAADQFLLKTTDTEHAFSYDREQLHEDPFHNAKKYEFTLITESGIEIPVIHIDRGSDTLVILGQGMSSPKEHMLPTATLLDSYDVLLFDYRWCTCFNSMQLKAILTGSFFSRMFRDEVEDVRTVLAHARKIRPFTKVIGVGLCYSATLFSTVQAESQEHEGFTHLVLDSCMTSVEAMGRNLAADPYLMAPAHEGGAPWWLTTVTGSPFMTAFIRACFMCARDINAAKDIKQCSCPILFIHGKKDPRFRKRSWNPSGTRQIRNSV